jgi:hypothetical protein
MGILCSKRSALLHLLQRLALLPPIFEFAPASPNYHLDAPSMITYTFPRTPQSLLVFAATGPDFGGQLPDARSQPAKPNFEKTPFTIFPRHLGVS